MKKRLSRCRPPILITLASAVLLPLQAVETKVVPLGGGGAFVYNTFGKTSGEPKLLDLTGTHIINLPPGPEFHFIDLAVGLRHLDSGELEIASVTVNFKPKGLAVDRVVLSAKDHPRIGGGRILADRTMRLWISGDGIGNLIGSLVGTDLEFAGSVKDRGRGDAELDLTATGSLLIESGDTYRRRISKDPVEVRSSRLLRPFVIFTQLGKNGPRYLLQEGSLSTLVGNTENYRGYFPTPAPLEGRRASGLSSRRLKVGSAPGWLRFEMNADFGITKLTGVIGGQEVSYEGP